MNSSSSKYTLFKMKADLKLILTSNLRQITINSSKTCKLVLTSKSNSQISISTSLMNLKSRSRNKLLPLNLNKTPEFSSNVSIMNEISFLKRHRLN